MIISVASGKGGAGKTTIATNLAVALEMPVQLLDCDVEEPTPTSFSSPSSGKGSIFTWRCRKLLRPDAKPIDFF